MKLGPGAMFTVVSEVCLKMRNSW